jgi:hypothetical protein
MRRRNTLRAIKSKPVQESAVVIYEPGRTVSCYGTGSEKIARRAEIAAVE